MNNGNILKARNYNCILLIIFLFLIILSNLVFALEEQNITIENNARICLNESKEIFKELAQENFSVQRVNDSLKEAEIFFETQDFLKEKKGKYDFSLVLPYCEDIKKIKEDAFEARDEFEALKKFYNDFLTEDMNTTIVDNLIEEIKQEIESERYEKTKPLIDEAYEEIVNIKSSHTTLNLFYKTTTRSIKDFFYENWIYIISGLLILSILFVIYKKAILKWWIKRKISRLEVRKKTIKSLIKKTQRDYFDLGKIPGGAYSIRTKKFAELIRDIDRQIPLLKGEIIKAGGNFEVLKKKEKGPKKEK